MTTLQAAFAEYRRVRLDQIAIGAHIAAMLGRDLLRVLGARPLDAISGATSPWCCMR